MRIKNYFLLSMLGFSASLPASLLAFAPDFEKIEREACEGAGGKIVSKTCEHN